MSLSCEADAGCIWRTAMANGIVKYLQGYPDSCQPSKQPETTQAGNLWHCDKCLCACDMLHSIHSTQHSTVNNCCLAVGSLTSAEGAKVHTLQYCSAIIDDAQML